MLIRNKENRNIAVAKGHGYTVDKVRKAMDFINHSGRYTTVQDWVEMYNFIKGTSEKVSSCRSCAAAKYTASVRNYARLGYLTLLNEGHTPEEFGIGEKKQEEPKPVENEEKRVVLEEKVEEPKEDAVIENVKEALQEEPVQEEATEEPKVEDAVEEPKPKRGRKSSK